MAWFPITTNISPGHPELPKNNRVLKQILYQPCPTFIHTYKFRVWVIKKFDPVIIFMFILKYNLVFKIVHVKISYIFTMIWGPNSLGLSWDKSLCLHRYVSHKMLYRTVFHKFDKMWKNFWLSIINLGPLH